MSAFAESKEEWQPAPDARPPTHWLQWPKWYLPPLALLSLIILTLGAVEDLYGNTDSGDAYGSDAVQYLDIARAIARHDWRSALNPLWSQGYPTLLALFHSLFPVGAEGDWWVTRSANFTIFVMSYAAFLYFLFTVLPLPCSNLPDDRKQWLRRAIPCLLLFAAAQVCLGQVSRVNPDELVTAIFLLACAQLVRLLRRAGSDGRTLWGPALVLGLLFGLGFLVKAVFLALGSGMLVITAVALWRRHIRPTPILAAAAVFATVVFGYGAALSHAVGYRTLGEAGSINYAWHVDRLQKWVHWEGGVQPADEAWPKPWIARAAQWSTRPPDFGLPVHPSVLLQQSPTVYGFAAPVHATYVPYFDPPYFYQGYRHTFRVRYQAIALLKSLGDLLQVLLRQPLVWALALALVVWLRTAAARRMFIDWFRSYWPLAACCCFGVLLYLPIHLEGRYLAGMLLVLGTCGLLAATVPEAATSNRLAAAILLLGFAAELGLYQAPAWRNLLHGKSPEANAEWRMGIAALDQHLPPDAPVGVIAWTPNLHSDWAYIAHLQIVSEIGSGPDYDQFWHMPPERQTATLSTFRRAGAVAVFVNGKPPGLGGPGWQQLNGTPLWMVRLQQP